MVDIEVIHIYHAAVPGCPVAARHTHTTTLAEPHYRHSTSLRTRAIAGTSREVYARFFEQALERVWAIQRCHPTT